MGLFKPRWEAGSFPAVTSSKSCLPFRTGGDGMSIAQGECDCGMMGIGAGKMGSARPGGGGMAQIFPKC